jgi:hypothetical protein
MIDERTLPVITGGPLLVGERVKHRDDGVVGTIQAFWVVWDKGQKGERSGYYSPEVLDAFERRGK